MPTPTMPTTSNQYEQKPADQMTQTPITSEVDISTLSTAAGTPAAAKLYPYEVKLEQCSPGIRITVHARDEDQDVVDEKAIAHLQTDQNWQHDCI